MKRRSLTSLLIIALLLTAVPYKFTSTVYGETLNDGETVSENEAVEKAPEEVKYYAQEADFGDILNPYIGEPYEISAEEADAPEDIGEITLNTEVDRAAIKAYLRACIYNRDKVIDTSSFGMTFEEISEIMSDIHFNDPLMFFWSGGCSGRMYGITGICYVIYPYDYISAEKEAAMRRAGAIALSESITEDMSERQKAIALHEWVSGNVVYDHTYSKSDVYDALVDRCSVCQGYAETYQLLCIWAGLECQLLSGGNHAWNRVKVDGKWYCVDCTWDENIKTNPSGMSHANLLKSDAYMIEYTGHSYSGERYCTDTSYDYADVFWDDTTTKSDCPFYYFNSAGCYRLRWADQNNCNLVFYNESTGNENVIRTFHPGKTGYRGSIKRNRGMLERVYCGVSLDRLGKYLYINDGNNIYRFDPSSGSLNVIYTYNRSGDYLYALNVYKDQLIAIPDIGDDFVVPISEADTYSGNTSAADTSALASYNLGSPGVTGFVKRLYTVCLGRNYDSEGLNYWCILLNTGERDAANVASGFFFGDEFKNKNLSDSDFVDVMYKTMMGRNADEGGKAYWMKMLSYGVTREYVYKGFTGSAEFTKLCEDYGVQRGDYELTSYRDKNAGATGFISRLYTKMLGRSYDAEGLEYWCRAYMSGEQSIETVATNGFLHSKELENMHLSDREYVERMYLTFLDREPEEAGLKYWMDELSSGRKNRDTLVYGFTLSQEFSDIKRSFGLQ